MTVLFLCGLFSVHAQTAGFFMDPNSEEPRFIQWLRWSGGMYSLHCEVVIEKEEGGVYVSHFREFNTDNYLEISLPPGNYRFRVIPYDILGKPGTGTQWKQITVFSAVRPELSQPEKKPDSIVDEQELLFAFNGKNLEPGADIYFVGSNGDRIIPIDSIISDDGSSVSLIFNKGQLSDGEYEVVVINPGGLKTSLGGINYESPKKMTAKLIYIVGVSWIPLYPAYGGGFGDDWNFTNISARISVNSCMFNNNYIGMEFTLMKFPDSVPNMPNGFVGGFNILFINWLSSQKASFNFRAGVNFTIYPFDYSCSNIGISFLFRMFKHLGIEAGINYMDSFYDGGGIQPWIGLNILF
jgi:hypothetical protein